MLCWGIWTLNIELNATDISIQIYFLIGSTWDQYHLSQPISRSKIHKYKWMLDVLCCHGYCFQFLFLIVGSIGLTHDVLQHLSYSHLRFYFHGFQSILAWFLRSQWSLKQHGMDGLPISCSYTIIDFRNSILRW